MPQKLLVTLVAALGAQAAVGTPCAAQKVGRAWHEDTRWGFKFRPLESFLVVPLQPHQAGGALIGRMKGPRVRARTKAEGDSGWNYVELDTRLYAFADRGDDAPGHGMLVPARLTIAEELIGTYRGFDRTVARSPDVEEPFRVGKVDGTHRAWTVRFDDVEAIIDTWTFHLADADVAIVYTTVPDKREKYLRAFEKSARTFRTVPRQAEPTGPDDDSYDALLTRAQAECARTEGWCALPTPSRKFIVKTSSENRRFLDAVIERLEKSRLVFEEDFPPPEDFDAVSIVRVCSTREEFSAYGGTGEGTVGWFSPSTGELVLYDAVETDRNKSYAVMSHEAFHQYCHQLFGRSEAHRWFDEGHGDYYGGLRMRGGRLEVTPKMPDDLDRLSVIRDMHRENTYAPLAQHLYADHEAWHEQGPGRESSYAQSWSIVYMLRQGMLGNVHHKCWRDEYASIIPNYVAALREGFDAAYDERRRQVRARARVENREASEEELRLTAFQPSDETRRLVWDKAMEASWGRIDLAQFERDWSSYVDKYLK